MPISAIEKISQSDLILDSINTSLTNTAADVFTWDISQDSDGGAWREKTSNTAWYNEPLNTATRGKTKNFPAKGIGIVEADNITLYDATDSTVPMWIKYNTNAVQGSLFYAFQSYPLGTGVLRNGILAFGSSTESVNAGLRVLNFSKDIGYKFTANDDFSGTTIGIESTNARAVSVQQGLAQLVHNTVHDVDISQDGTIAAATSGGVSVLSSTSSGIAISDPSGTGRVSFSADGTELWLSAITGASDIQSVGSIPIIDETVGNWRDRFYNRANSTPALLSSSTGQLSLFNVVGSPNGVTRFLDKDTVAYITNSYNSGCMYKDIKGAFLANSDTIDRSVNANPLTAIGTLTEAPVATGAELMGYSGWSASNYREQPYSADLDFGTGDFFVMGWVFALNDTNTGYIFERSDISEAGGLLAIRKAAGAATANKPRIHLGATGFNTLLDSSIALTADSWNLLTVYRVSGVVYVNINAKDAGSLASTDNITNVNAVTKIGDRLTASNPVTGSLALWRIGAGAPTENQIAKIYADERSLFQENALCTLSGASSDVQAIALDKVTNELHVCTATDRSVFNGLVMVDEENAAYTSLSANNRLIAKGN